MKIKKRWVNAFQTPETRRAKYKIARDLGHDSKQANRWRDAEFPKMYRALGQKAPTGKEREKVLTEKGATPDLKVSRERKRTGEPYKKDIDSIEKQYGGETYHCKKCNKGHSPYTKIGESHKEFERATLQCPNCRSKYNETHKYKNCPQCGDRLEEKYYLKKDISSIKDEAQPQKPKTKLQDKIIGDVKYLEKKTVEKALSEAVSTIEKQVKIYLEAGEEAPEGKTVLNGPHGGKYYIGQTARQQGWRHSFLLDEGVDIKPTNKHSFKGIVGKSQEQLANELAGINNPIEADEWERRSQQKIQNLFDFIDFYIRLSNNSKAVTNTEVKTMARILSSFTENYLKAAKNEYGTKDALLKVYGKIEQTYAELKPELLYGEKSGQIMAIDKFIAISHRVEPSILPHIFGLAIFDSRIEIQNYLMKILDYLFENKDEGTPMRKSFDLVREINRLDIMQKQTKVYLKADQMPPGDEEVMRGEKGGRYYLASGGGGMPVMPEGEEQPEAESNGATEKAGETELPEPPEQKEAEEPNIVPARDNKDSKMQKIGYVKIDESELTKILSNTGKSVIERIKEQIKEFEKTPDIEENLSEGKKTEILNKIEKIQKSAENYELVGEFVRGYKEFSLLGKSYPQENLAELHQKASRLTRKSFTGSTDRVDLAIEVDMVAHDLHTFSKQFTPRLYPILDELAALSKDLGETLRDDRLLYLSKSADSNQIELLNGIEVFTKSVEFDSSKSFWGLAKKAIKRGVHSLDDDELVLLREWIYSRI